MYCVYSGVELSLIQSYKLSYWPPCQPPPRCRPIPNITSLCISTGEYGSHTSRNIIGNHGFPLFPIVH